MRIVTEKIDRIDRTAAGSACIGALCVSSFGSYSGSSEPVSSDPQTSTSMIGAAMNSVVKGKVQPSPILVKKFFSAGKSPHNQASVRWSIQTSETPELFLNKLIDEATGKQSENLLKPGSQELPKPLGRTYLLGQVLNKRSCDWTPEENQLFVDWLEKLKRTREYQVVTALLLNFCLGAEGIAEEMERKSRGPDLSAQIIEPLSLSLSYLRISIGTIASLIDLLNITSRKWNSEEVESLFHWHKNLENFPLYREFLRFCGLADQNIHFRRLNQ